LAKHEQQLLFNATPPDKFPKRFRWIGAPKGKTAHFTWQGTLYSVTRSKPNSNLVGFTVRDVNARVHVQTVYYVPGAVKAHYVRDAVRRIIFEYEQKRGPVREGGDGR